ncbi:hypothetical protein Vretimale_6209 [Volvox reticuliferus]|nr:hypothetical protein Vretifemale_8010 [Volvox reticuliferus]GIM01382.1 hypothetical protein Vretimale_6209 [Volvox reticuliferus]
MVHLREEHSMKEELRGVLQPQEVEAVTSAVHPPSFCLQMITWIIRTAGLPQELIIRMDENVSRLTDAVSACERILNTPIPLSYTRHTARFLMAWLVCLPFSLWSYCGLAMVTGRWGPGGGGLGGWGFICMSACMVHVCIRVV